MKWNTSEFIVLTIILSVCLMRSSLYAPRHFVSLIDSLTIMMACVARIPTNISTPRWLHFYNIRHFIRDYYLFLDLFYLLAIATHSYKLYWNIYFVQQKTCRFYDLETCEQARRADHGKNTPCPNVFRLPLRFDPVNFSFLSPSCVFFYFRTAVLVNSKGNDFIEVLKIRTGDCQDYYSLIFLLKPSQQPL